MIKYNVENGKVRLSSMTEEMHETGSKLIEDLLLEENIPFPVSLPKNAFDQESWKDTVTLVRSYTVILQMQVSLTVIYICTYLKAIFNI